MKASSLLTLALLSMTCTFANAIEMGKIRVGNTPARSIALESNLPGKSVLGSCKPFAVALNQRFAAAKIHSQVVGFNYATFGGHPDSQGHAVVIYEDEGRTYIMDNQMSRPVWVPNSASLREKVGQIAGVETNVISAWNLKVSPAKCRPNSHGANSSLAGLASHNSKSNGTK